MPTYLDPREITSTSTPTLRTSWRDVLPIHPAAELSPLMSPDKLRALGEDIKANGLTSPISIKSAKDASGWQYWLLDGRNRLDAMEVVGIPARLELINGQCSVIMHADTDHDFSDANVIESDPYAYVASANLHRRHLTAEQKRDLTAKLIKAQPEKSDRHIAEQAKSNRTTVGQIRKALEKAGDVSIVDTRTDSNGRKQPARKARKQPTPKPSNRAADQDVSPQPAAPKREPAKKAFFDVNRSHERERRRFEATLCCIRESCESTVDMVLPRALTREDAAEAINSLSKSAEQISMLLQRLRSQHRLLEPNPDGGRDIPAYLQRTTPAPATGGG